LSGLSTLTVTEVGDLTVTNLKTKTNIYISSLLYKTVKLLMANKNEKGS